MQASIKEFALSKEQLLVEAQQVEKQIEQGLAGQPSDFSMLPSYLALPSGREQGNFLALDFGGTNVRIARLVLADGKIEQQAVLKKAIAALASDKLLGTQELFLQIAQMISEFTPEQGGLLGHTFSYPVLQTGVNTGRLQRWTKEISFADGAGIDVNTLLSKQLQAIGRPDIVPVAILNDTVAVLLASAYESGSQQILGSICGTGHNTAFFAPPKNMVINLESGNFRCSSQNKFDRLLDEKSTDPGLQLFEKMVAGNYLARLVHVVAEQLGLDVSKVKTAYDLALILQNKEDLLYTIVYTIIKRAANLVAAEYYGLYMCLQKQGVILQKIAIDGSIFNKIDLFNYELMRSLQEFIKQPPTLVSGHSYSLKGAAVACSLAG